MKRILLYILKVAICLIPLSVHASELFKPVAEQALRQGNSAAAQALSKVRAQSKLTSSMVVEIDRDALLGNVISITVPGLETLIIPKRSEKRLEGGKVIWEGRDGTTSSTFFGVLTADGLRGSFYSAKHGAFFIEPVDGKLHIVGKREPIAPHPAGSERRPLRPADPSSKSNSTLESLAATGKVVIDVVVWYAPAVGKSVADTLVPNGIAAANSHFSNSQLAVELRLVGLYSYPYTVVATDIEQTLNIFQASFGVTDVMDTSGADIALLVVPNNGECGLTDIGPSKALARSVLTVECVQYEMGLSHEVGHMMGAGHDSNGPGPWRYSYGRAYYGPADSGGCVRTILAYYRPCSTFFVNHVPYFSNVVLRLGSAPLGSNTEDNARVIREQAATVAAFRTPVGSGGGSTGPTPEERARAILPTLVDLLLN